VNRTDQLLASGVQRRTPEAAREIISSHFAGDTAPYERIEELRAIGAKKAEAEGVAYQLEHERKIILARLANEYAQAHSKHPLSEAKLDRLSRADSRYQDHIKGLAVAIENREKWRSEYWAIKSLLEWDKAAIAHLNALSKLEEPV
jgi:hypothetical protein